MKVERSRANRIVFVVGMTLLAAGVASVALSLILIPIVVPATPWIETPISTESCLAVDPRGRIYVGDLYTGRIQRFSPNGVFEGGWFPETGGGRFALHASEDGHVEVASARDPIVTKYDSEGQKVDTRDDATAWNRYSLNEARNCPLVIHKGWQVSVRDRQTGNVIVQDTWIHRAIAVPFPAMLYWAVGLSLAGIAEIQRKRSLAARNFGTTIKNP